MEDQYLDASWEDRNELREEHQDCYVCEQDDLEAYNANEADDYREE